MSGVGRLRGKRVLVTGISRGQGRAAAELFAREGASVAGCGRQAGGAERVAEELRGEGLDARAQTVDLTDADAAAAWVEWAVAEMGGCDVLYNNAGMGAFGGIDELEIETWQKVIDVDLNAVFYVTRAAWPHLRSGGGSIVNTASVAGMAGFGLVPSVALVAAKGAVIALTRQLAVEGAPHGVRANTVTPHYVEASAETMALIDPELRQRIVDELLLKRPGSVADVAAAALFLASDESAWITGANLPVDGGWTAGRPLSS